MLETFQKTRIFLQIYRLELTGRRSSHLTGPTTVRSELLELQHLLMMLLLPLLLQEKLETEVQRVQNLQIVHVLHPKTIMMIEDVIVCTGVENNLQYVTILEKQTGTTLPC